MLLTMLRPAHSPRGLVTFFAIVCFFKVLKRVTLFGLILFKHTSNQKIKSGRSLPLHRARLPAARPDCPTLFFIIFSTNISFTKNRQPGSFG